MCVQYYAGKAVETQAGFLRTMLIYIISGVGGYVLSGIFSPQTVSTGADPAVYGLLGVMMVELFQAWQIVPDAVTQLVKLLVIIGASLLVGTFPFVDNWSHVGGFFFGVVSGIVFLPYITFGKWDARRKRLLLVLCIPSLVVMIIVSWLTFYLIQNTEVCTWYVTTPCVQPVRALSLSLFVSNLFSLSRLSRCGSGSPFRISLFIVVGCRRSLPMHAAQLYAGATTSTASRTPTTFVHRINKHADPSAHAQSVPQWRYPTANTV